MDLTELLRSCDVAGAIRVLGEDYDFREDACGVLGTATWYSCNDFVLHAVSKGASVNTECLNGTPLGIAAGMGNIALAKFFMERGADIDRLDSHGRSALVHAASQGNLPMVKLLVNAGADLANALSAAVEGAYENIVKFLIDARAAVNEIADADRAMPPLLLACSKGKKKGSSIALLLLRSGADATYVRPGDGMSAVEFALWGQCSDEVLQELIDRGAQPPEPGFPVVRLT